MGLAMNYLYSRIICKTTLYGQVITPFTYSIVFKAASTAICNTVAKHLGITPGQVPSANQDWKHFGVSLKDPPEGYHFSIVRNTYDRVVSTWSLMTNQREPLETFVENNFRFNPDDPHIASQLRTLKPVPEFIGTLENIEHDWKIIQQNTGLSNLIRENQSQRKPDYRAYYTPRAKELVKEFYLDEIKTFGFEFD